MSYIVLTANVFLYNWSKHIRVPKKIIKTSAFGNGRFVDLELDLFSFVRSLREWERVNKNFAGWNNTLFWHTSFLENFIIDIAQMCRQ